MLSLWHGPSGWTVLSAGSLSTEKQQGASSPPTLTASLGLEFDIKHVMFHLHTQTKGESLQNYTVFDIN